MTHIEDVFYLGTRVRLAPVGLIMYARSFLLAAQQIRSFSEIEFMPARTYSVCHALELALKAFLSLKGHSLEKLAEGKFGHDLENIPVAALDHGLSDIVEFTESQRYQIYRASKYYAAKAFEYPAVGEVLLAYPTCPTPTL